MDFVVSAKDNVKLKESEKIDQFRDFDSEQNTMKHVSRRVTN